MISGNRRASWEWQILQEWQSPTLGQRHHSWEWEIKLPERVEDAPPDTENFLEGEARYKILERLGKGAFGEVRKA